MGGMNRQTPRRVFLARSLAFVAGPAVALAAGEVTRRPGTKIKLALNSYSFNGALMSGKMSLDDVIDYCAAHNIDGVDLTGYYFPGYPKVPADEYIYSLKKRAYLNGVSISGTGVRNDFTLVDPAARKVSIDLVKDWVVVGPEARSLFYPCLLRTVHTERFELREGARMDDPCVPGMRRLWEKARRDHRAAAPRRLPEERRSRPSRW